MKKVEEVKTEIEPAVLQESVQQELITGGKTKKKAQKKRVKRKKRVFKQKRLKF